MLVLMAAGDDRADHAATAPLRKGTEIDEPIARSGFLGTGAANEGKRAKNEEVQEGRKHEINS